MLCAGLFVAGCTGVDSSTCRGALQQRGALPGDRWGEGREESEREPQGEDVEERDGASRRLLYRRSPLMEETSLGARQPRGMQSDAFDALLRSAGLEERDTRPVEGSSLTPVQAARLLEVLLGKEVTLGQFPARVAVGFMLREVLEAGEASRAELVRRVGRFEHLAVLRPDGCLAWVHGGKTQQRVGPVGWKDGAFRAGLFELGVFYSGRGGVFRELNSRLEESGRGAFAEVYDDADSVSRTLDGAQEAFIELTLAVGQFFSKSPADNLAALQHMPAAMAALLASAPEYLERFRYMTRGEQIQVISKMVTNLIATWGTASATTRTITGALAGAEATVPVLSLSVQGALAIERVTVPVGRAAAVLGGGPGAAIILQRASTAAKGAGPSAGPGQWGPAKESMKPPARRYQEQITGHSADDAYWVGGMSTKSGGVKFDGFKDGVLLEAKGPGYAKFFEELEPKDWFRHSGAQGLIEQARRQLSRTQGTGIPIRWHVAEESAAEAIRLLLDEAKVRGIEVVHTPAL